MWSAIFLTWLLSSSPSPSSHLSLGLWWWKSLSLSEANDLPLCEAYWRLDLDTDPADGLLAPLLVSRSPVLGPCKPLTLPTPTLVALVPQSMSELLWGASCLLPRTGSSQPWLPLGEPLQPPWGPCQLRDRPTISRAAHSSSSHLCLPPPWSAE